MIYCIKCNKCEYVAEVSVTGWVAFEKFKEKNKCPECKGDIVTDVATQGKGMMFRVGFSGGGYSKGSDRLERANNRRTKKKVHEKNIRKDPYYDMREKNDPRKVVYG